MVWRSILNIVIQSNFSQVLGDKLKDFPQIVSKTALISIQNGQQNLGTSTQIFLLRNNSTVQITELEVTHQGYIYCMVLPESSADKDQLTPLHVKFGIDVANQKALWTKRFFVWDTRDKYFFNIDSLNVTKTFPETDKFEFYYIATGLQADRLSPTTKLLKIPFSIHKFVQVTRA